LPTELENQETFQPSLLPTELEVANKIMLNIFSHRFYASFPLW
jgi:hypothetical protein